VLTFNSPLPTLHSPALRVSADKSGVEGVECCVEACLIDCYLSDSGLYVHKSCCLGVQRHLPTYESCSRFQDGHETNDETNVVSDLRDME
jgi:hypothetical protein